MWYGKAEREKLDYRNLLPSKKPIKGKVFSKENPSLPIQIMLSPDFQI
jgi:hypothetical protein